MERELDVFINYVIHNYDINDACIKEKFWHTIRVGKLMLLLAKRLHLSDDDTLLAYQIALFHDLGRFREVERNRDKEQKFNNKTFNHGAYSNKVLYNDMLISSFHTKRDDDLIIRKAAYWHGQQDLPDNLSSREKMFCQMIRDVDKLDILFIRSQKKKLIFRCDYSQEIFNAFCHKKTINVRDLKGNSSNSVIFYLDFIRLLCYEEIFDIAISEYLPLFLTVVEPKDALAKEKLCELVGMIDPSLVGLIFKEEERKEDEGGAYVKKYA